MKRLIRTTAARLLAILTVLTLVFSISPPLTAAATWTVTKTADTNDGACDSDCSLREAIAAAASGDTITGNSMPYVPPQLPGDIAADWWTTVQEQIQRSEYDITWQESTYLTDLPTAYQAPNRAQGLRTYFAPQGPIIIPRSDDTSWQLALQLIAWGWAGAPQAAGNASLQASGPRIEYRYPDLVEWYVNDEQGLEQGFTLAAPQGTDMARSTDAIVVELALATDLAARLAWDGAVELVDPAGAVVLRYGSLYATDAEGHALPTRLALVSGQLSAVSRQRSAIRLTVDAAAAAFPITLDPTITGLSPTAGWTAESDQASAQFGISVGTAGDVNGDGYDDVIVGADGFDNGQADEGRAYVYHGSATGLSSTAAWTAESDLGSIYFGRSVNTAGDVNGDGYADVVVGAPGYDNGQRDEGRAYVYQGSAAGLSATAAWTAESDRADAQFGNSAGTAGDVNGDGYADVIVGALNYGNGLTSGRVFAYHGGPTGLGAAAAWTAEGDQAGAIFGVAVGTAGDVNGDGYGDVIVGDAYYTNGQRREGRAYVFHGGAAGLSASAAWTAESDQIDAFFGQSLAAASDVNGDGYADVIVGAWAYTNGQTQEGGAWLYYGSAAGLGASAGWMAEGNQWGARFGYAVGTAGDVNGDGYADVIVGAVRYNNGQTNGGRAFVYYGGATSLATSAAWTADGNQSASAFGLSVGTAGDVNGDGYADVIVGAPSYANGQTYEGRAYVFHGAATGLSPTANWAAESNQSGAYFGGAAGTAGDVNGDGYDDVIVGAYRFDNGQTDEGRVFVYYGSASGLGTTAAWTAESDQAYSFFGGPLEVGTAGDVNGDGYADIIIGAQFYDNGQTDEGAAWVWYGSAAGLVPNGTPLNADWAAESNQASAYFGYSVGTAGDVNGDGYADVIVGAFGYDGDQSNEGRVFVYTGSASGLSPSAAWTAESDQTDPNWFTAFGLSAGTAGDVNGDGYADVIVGAARYDRGQADEGAAFVWHGSALGLGPNGNPANADWIGESNVSVAEYGNAVAGAGDVNGDGYADVIVGAHWYDGWRGRAYIYHGSTSGLSTSAAWSVAGNQTYAQYGLFVAGAGDVNGDGYADIIVGEPYYDNPQSNEGRAHVYHGSAAGLGTSAAWTAESDQVEAGLGQSVGAAGDVNGDGYADVIAGAPGYDNGQADEGRAYVYYGNASGGLALRPQQRRADDSAPVAPGGQVISPMEARLAALARTPFGRSDVALQWEVKPEEVAFNGAGLSQSAWQDSGTAGYAFDQLVSSLSFETRYHWRVRILGRPHNAVSSLVTYRSRWLRPAGNTFFTTLSGEQPISGLGSINLLGQAAHVDVGAQGTLTNLTLRGYPQTAHPQANAYTGFGFGSQVLDRYFSITPNGGATGYSAGLCLNYDDAEVAAAGATESLLVLCRWTGTAWDCRPRATGSDMNANLVCADGVTGFSDWVLAQGPLNSPPTVAGVTLSPDPPKTDDILTATASGVGDPDGDAVTLTFVWLVNGTIVQTTANAAGDLDDTLDLNVAGNGNKGDTIRVEVTPNDGQVNGDTASAEVTIANSPPVAEANGPCTVAEGGSVTLDSTGSYDPDPGDTLTYAWDLDNDGVYETPGAAPNFAGVDGPASHPVTLQVCDPQAACSTDATTVEVTNVAPTAQAGADVTVYRDEPASLAGTWTDPAAALDEQYAWTWDLDGDGVADASGSAAYGVTAPATASFAAEGAYDLTFTVADADGDSGQDSVRVTVLNRAPDCSAAAASPALLWPPSNKFVPVSIGGVADADGDPLTLAVTGIRQDEPVGRSLHGRGARERAARPGQACG